MKALTKQRADILALENAMRELPGFEEGDGPCKIINHFAPGCYARVMWAPADTVITGKIHKTSHLNILAEGKITVSTDGESKTFEAPHVFVSPVGVKRAGYTHTDCTWITIHPTESTDLEKIESEIIAETFEELDLFLEHEDRKRIK